MRVKKSALKDRVHLNDLKLYLERPAITEEENMVDLREYGEGDGERWEHMGGVYDLGAGSTGACNGGREMHVHWWEQAQGVG